MAATIEQVKVFLNHTKRWSDSEDLREYAENLLEYIDDPDGRDWVVNILADGSQHVE